MTVVKIFIRCRRFISQCHSAFESLSSFWFYSELHQHMKSIDIKICSICFQNRKKRSILTNQKQINPFEIKLNTTRKKIFTTTSIVKEWIKHSCFVNLMHICLVKIRLAYKKVDHGILIMHLIFLFNFRAIVTINICTHSWPHMFTL